MCNIYFFLSMNIFTIWLIFASPALAQHPCTEPRIKAFESPIHIYKETDIVEIDVYNCRYLETDSFYKCNHNFDESDKLYTTLINSYSDFTQRCIIALKNGTYVNKYSRVYQLGKSDQYTERIPYGCTKNMTRIKDVTITLKKRNAVADLKQDTLKLPSGTICKYSYGFCYDNQEDTALVWEVISNTNSASFNCSKLERILIDSQCYFLTLDRTTYLISSINNNFVPLEVQKEKETKCGVELWKTKKSGLFVSEKIINEAKTSNATAPVKEKDYGSVYFDNKRSLYNYLASKCYSDTIVHSDNYQIIRSVFEVSVQVEQVASSTERCTVRIKQVHDDLLAIIGYVGAAFLVYAVCSIVILVYVVYAKYFGKRVTKNNGGGTSADSKTAVYDDCVDDRVIYNTAYESVS